MNSEDILAITGGIILVILILDIIGDSYPKK